jgi:hypothetical protein
VLSGFIADAIGEVTTEPATFPFLGSEFLQQSIQGRLTEVVWAQQDGMARAMHAVELFGSERDREVERAAEQLAAGIGILVRLILEGIAAYARPGRRVATEDEATQLVNQLAAGRLGKDFASWVATNWKGLIDDPRLRATPRGGGSAYVERAVFDRKPPVAATTPPASDSPTFSDVDLVSQAAALVAAAAQGKPFCPE